MLAGNQLHQSTRHFCSIAQLYYFAGVYRCVSSAKYGSLIGIIESVHMSATLQYNLNNGRPSPNTGFQ